MQQTRLLSIMKRELESSQLEISSYCEQQIEQLVGQGINRMRTTNTLDHPGFALQAERNLVDLIKYFCKYARKEGSYPKLSDIHFDAALRTCPTLWPFCSSG